MKSLYVCIPFQLLCCHNSKYTLSNLAIYCQNYFYLVTNWKNILIMNNFIFLNWMNAMSNVISASLYL
jgi:hypothetical protein